MYICLFGGQSCLTTYSVRRLKSSYLLVASCKKPAKYTGNLASRDTFLRAPFLRLFSGCGIQAIIDLVQCNATAHVSRNSLSRDNAGNLRELISTNISCCIALHQMSSIQQEVLSNCDVIVHALPVANTRTVDE